MEAKPVKEPQISPDTFDSFIDSLMESDREVLAAAPTKKGESVKYPCGQCCGTGRYQGARVHQEKAHCFACRGLGYFKTSPEVRRKAREAAARKARNALERGLAATAENHPALFADLREAYALREGSGFIISLADQLFSKGSLSDKQIDAWYRGKARLEEIRAQRAAEAKARAVSGVDLTPIRTMFETAMTNGYKRPTYRAEGLVINRAPDTGNNPGALYIKDEAGEYKGKIVGTTFHPVRNASGVGEALLVIAKDPLQAALRYGQRTGNCACCGRTLTNHASIDAGIGPICAQKWGF